MVNKIQRGSNGYYNIKGHKYPDLEGSRAQVWHGTAYKTAGGLTKADLVKNSQGYIVSKKKHITAKREKRLEKHGYRTRKGKFGSFKVGSKKRRGGRQKGGSDVTPPAAN